MITRTDTYELDFDFEKKINAMEYDGWAVRQIVAAPVIKSSGDISVTRPTIIVVFEMEQP